MSQSSVRDFWAIAVSGEPSAMDTWRRMLDPRFDPHIVEVPDRPEFLIRSTQLDQLTDAREVYEAAAVMVGDINCSIRSLCDCAALKATCVFQINTDGSSHGYIFLKGTMPGAIALRGYLSVSSGEAEAKPQPSLVQKWAALASTDDIVRDMIRNAGGELNWYNLYKAFEGARALAKRTGGLHKKQWAPEAVIDNFQHTANCMRHGRSHAAWKKPPDRFMPIDEAADLVRTLVNYAMREILQSAKFD